MLNWQLFKPGNLFVIAAFVLIANILFSRAKSYAAS